MFESLLQPRASTRACCSACLSWHLGGMCPIPSHRSAMRASMATCNFSWSALRRFASCFRGRDRRRAADRKTVSRLPFSTSWSEPQVLQRASALQAIWLASLQLGPEKLRARQLDRTTSNWEARVGKSPIRTSMHQPRAPSQGRKMPVRKKPNWDTLRSSFSNSSLSPLILSMSANTALCFAATSSCQGKRFPACDACQQSLPRHDPALLCTLFRGVSGLQGVQSQRESEPLPPFPYRICDQMRLQSLLIFS